MELVNLKKEIKKMDKKIDFNSTAGKAALFLMASVIKGNRITAISKYIEIPVKELRTFHDQAVYNGIFKGKKIHADWFSKNGGISFWLDVNCVMGLMKRAL